MITIKGFKAYDKVWWVSQKLEGVKIYPVTIIDPNLPYNTKVQLRDGSKQLAFKHELYPSHGEATQALSDLEAFKFHEKAKEEGWK